MRSLVDGQVRIESQADTVGKALEALVDEYPELNSRLFSDTGDLVSYVSVFVGDTNILDLSGMDTNLEGASELLIISALAGG